MSKLRSTICLTLKQQAHLTSLLLHRVTESPRNHLCNIWVSAPTVPEALGPRAVDV